MSTNAQPAVQEKPVMDFNATMDTGVLTHVKEEEKKDDKPSDKDKSEVKEEEKKPTEKELEEESDDDAEEEVEEEGEKTADDKSDKEKKSTTKEEKKPDDEESENVSVDDFVKDEYFEKYEVENKEQLDELLESASEILSENKELKKQLEAQKDNKPKFANTEEEKAFDFVKAFSSVSDGGQALAELVGMDIAKADAKLLLRQQFVIENPELTREEAARKFERQYVKKYSVPDKDKFDSDQEYEDAKEDAQMDLKRDSERAKKFLTSKQTEVKAKPAEKAQEKKLPELVTKSVEQNTKVIDDYTKGFKELIFSPTDDESDDFKFKFKPEQLKTIVQASRGWVNNPVSYDEKGEFVGGFDPETMVKKASYALFGDEIFGHLVDHLHTLANIKKAESTEGVKPTGTAKGKSGGMGAMNEYDQAEALAKQRKRVRGN